MNKLFTFIRDRHALLYKGFIFVASLSVIVYCCPRESKFRYDLSDIKDRPWSYDNLVAPFDYAIQKSTEELQDEKKDIQSNSIPYFRFDTTISNQNEQILSTQFVSIAPEFRREILIAVDKVYALGIRAVSNEVGKSSQDLVNVVFKNVVEEHHLSDFQDPLAADSLVLTNL